MPAVFFIVQVLQGIETNPMRWTTLNGNLENRLIY